MTGKRKDTLTSNPKQHHRTDYIKAKTDKTKM